MKVNVFADPDLERLNALISEAQTEIEALAAILPAAADAQWHSAPVPRPREGGSERGCGGIPDPTADTVADAKRQDVRVQVVRSERALRNKITTLRGSRLALVAALKVWDGEDHQ